VLLKTFLTIGQFRLELVGMRCRCDTFTVHARAMWSEVT
jgi:hypothetical protein